MSPRCAGTSLQLRGSWPTLNRSARRQLRRPLRSHHLALVQYATHTSDEGAWRSKRKSVRVGLSSLTELEIVISVCSASREIQNRATQSARRKRIVSAVPRRCRPSLRRHDRQHELAERRSACQPGHVYPDRGVRLQCGDHTGRYGSDETAYLLMNALA